MTEQILPLTGLMLAAYILGSIPTAVLVCHMMGIADPRRRGSGNPGTTNVLRIGTRQAAFVTLAGDIGKGLLALLPTILLELSAFEQSMCAIAVILGHLFSLFTRFKGGKGVATGLGVSLALCWPLALIQFICWAGVAAATKTASLASISTALISPIMIWLLAPEYLVAFTLMAALLLFSHRQNIQNILQGHEPRL